MKFGSKILITISIIFAIISGIFGLDAFLNEIDIPTISEAMNYLIKENPAITLLVLVGSFAGLITHFITYQK